VTYLLVDGENVDSTLGTILRGQPNPEDRPRWNKVMDYAKSLFDDEDIQAFFFINVKQGARIPYKFIHVLEITGYKPVLLSGSRGQVVDEGIKKMLKLISQKEGNIILITHDNGYCELLNEALTNHNRELAIFGFEEFVSSRYSKELPLTIYDLETQVEAFEAPLKRGEITSLEQFDPSELLK